MTTPTLPIGSSNSGTNDWSDVHGEDQAIVDAYTTDHTSGGHPGSWIQNGTIPSAKIDATGVLDADLASPNNSVYKTLLAQGGYYTGATVAGGPYWISGLAAIGQTASISSVQVPTFFDYTSGDYTVGSLTTKFRVKMEVTVGSTSPSTVTLTAGLYPVTISASAFTLGTVVTGSTALSSGLATNTISRFNSGDFSASAILTDPGVYVLACAIGSITVPASIAVNLQLQTRNV